MYRIKNRYFDGAILSNILDNVFEEEVEKIINQLSRITAVNGKIFVKLSPYLSGDMIEEYGLAKCDQNLYCDENGVYFLNLTSGEWIKLLDKYFEVEKFYLFPIQKGKMKERILLLRNKGGSENVAGDLM